MQHIKSAIRRAVASLYYAADPLLSRLRGKVAILMYHRVLPERELDRHFIQPGMYVRSDVFEMQVRFLSEHFRILSFSALLDHWKRRDLDRDQRYCVLTLDDGWLDNYVYAYPVLKGYNVPATIFLPTGLIGSNQWFWQDRLACLLKHCCVSGAGRRKKLVPLLKRYPWISDFKGERDVGRIDSAIEQCKELSDTEVYSLIAKMEKALGEKPPGERVLLNWEEIKEMSKDGISFGSHSSTHKMLTKLSPGELKKEVEDSFSALQKRGVNHVPVFCYPNGNHDREITKLVNSSGYLAAVSTRPGFENVLPMEIFSLKRIGVHNDISPTVPLFAWHISGLNHISPPYRGLPRRSACGIAGESAPGGLP